MTQLLSGSAAGKQAGIRLRPNQSFSSALRQLYLFQNNPISNTLQFWRIRSSGSCCMSSLALAAANELRSGLSYKSSMSRIPFASFFWFTFLNSPQHGPSTLVPTNFHSAERKPGPGSPIRQTPAPPPLGIADGSGASQEVAGTVPQFRTRRNGSGNS